MIVSKRGQPRSRVQDTMTDFAAQVNGLAVQRHKEKLLPSGCPIQCTISWQEFPSEMGGDSFKTQNVLIHQLTSQTANRMGSTRGADSQGIGGKQKVTNLMPGQKQRPVEDRQKGWVKKPRL